MKRAIILALLLAAAPATAQRREAGIGTNIAGREAAAATRSTGATGFERTLIQPANEAVEMGRATARCLVRTEPDRSARFAAAGFDVPVKVVYTPLQPMMEQCLGKRADAGIAAVQFSRRWLMGLVAEALVLKSPALALAPVPVGEVQYPKDLALEQADQRVVDAVATCLAYTDPARSEALVRSEFFSPAEKAAFTALMPSLQGCLFEGMTLQANRAGMRMATALALYRRSATPATVAKK